jgi:hypothetical protein
MDGACLPDCTRPCPDLTPVTGVTISQSAELLPSSIATYTCDETGAPPADGNAVRMCQRNGTWTGNSPTVCDRCSLPDHAMVEELATARTELARATKDTVATAAKHTNVVRKSASLATA